MRQGHQHRQRGRDDLHRGEHRERFGRRARPCPSHAGGFGDGYDRAFGGRGRGGSGFGEGYDRAFGGRRGRGHGSDDGGPFGPGGRGSGGGRGGRRRMFDSGELRLVLLKLIADEPRHGYDLIRQIEEMTGGAYAPSPGVIYPTLTLLGDMGQIAAQDSDSAKKLFAITADGEAELATHADAVAALITRLTATGERQQRTDSAPIRRAMGNLREVLVNRLNAPNIDTEALHQIVALIDEAAQKIERL